LILSSVRKSEFSLTRTGSVFLRRSIERGWTTGRYARFVGAAAVRIRTRGRVAETPSLPARLAGVAFQALEGLVRFMAPGSGEELVVVARRAS